MFAVTLLLTFTRGAVLGGVIAGVVCLPFLRGRLRVAAVAVLVALAAVGFAMPGVRARMVSAGGEEASATRGLVWSQGVRIISDHPLGVGLGNYSALVGRYYDAVRPEFTVRTCMLFSSEFIPPLDTADRNRMAILELDKLEGEKPPVLDAKWLKAVGEKMRRRLVDGWPRLAGLIETYRAALQGVGHSARGQDVFGTLLAVGDLLLHDHDPDSDTVAVPNHLETADSFSDLAQ